MTNAEQLVARIGNESTGTRVSVAMIGDIRSLGYDVIVDPLPEDAGHALIVPSTELIDAREACRRLATLFQFIDLP